MEPGGWHSRNGPGSGLLSLSTIGTLSIVVGVALVLGGLLFPGLIAWLLPSIARPTVSDGGLAALGVACLLSAVLVLALRGNGGSLPALIQRPPERGHSKGLTTVGRGFARRFRQARSVQHHSVTYHSPSQEEIDTRLREAAIDAYRRRTGVSRAEAIRAVDSGEWTDDPIAAAALGDDVIVPSRLWLRRRIDPNGAYEQEVERTAAAIRRLDNHD